MCEDNLNIDLIEKYLERSLDVDEIRRFEEKLENDEAFVRELNDMELLISGIKKAASLTSMDDKLDRFEKSLKVDEDVEEDAKTVYFDDSRTKRHVWVVAASIALIFVLSVSLLNTGQIHSSRKLYAEYYAPFEYFGTNRSIENEEADNWKNALHFYDNGKYQEALDRFNQIIGNNKELVNHPEHSLYKGNALMELNRHDEAIRIFESMISEDNGMTVQARWYLAMCYLFTNNSKKALPLLEEIAKLKASSYSQDAQTILDRIE